MRVTVTRDGTLVLVVGVDGTSVSIASSISSTGSSGVACAGSADEEASGTSWVTLGTADSGSTLGDADGGEVTGVSSPVMSTHRSCVLVDLPMLP